MSEELLYIVLLLVLFVVPRMIQRFGIPTAITNLGLGAAAGMGYGMFADNATVHLLSNFGIVALFLLAGLEVDFKELRSEGRVLIEYALIRLFGLAVVAYAGMQIAGLAWQPAALVALALLTPSNGFILSSIKNFGLDEQQQFWVKSKSIATELLALIVLFVVLQSTTPEHFLISSIELLAIVVAMPLLFYFFARWIIPHAPRSEFALLVMLALLAAYATEKLGVYYLVGAFVVGVAAQQFRRFVPRMSSDKMMHTVEDFASFFIPFYFFSAGVNLKASDFDAQAFLWGVLFVVIVIPLRLLFTIMHRRISLQESFSKSLPVALSLLPTLVFTLVLAEILRDRYQVSSTIFGGLIVYTVINTMIPGFILRVPPPDYDAPLLLEPDAIRDADGGRA